VSEKRAEGISRRKRSIRAIAATRAAITISSFPAMVVYPVGTILMESPEGLFLYSGSDLYP